MNTELVSALDSSILDAHERFVSAMRDCCNRSVDAANARLECGLHLIERRKNTQHGEWMSLFRTAKGKVNTDVHFEFPFDRMTATRWMSMAKHHPQPFTSAEEVQAFHNRMGQEAELLPAPDGHGEQNPGPSVPSRLIKNFGLMESTMTKHQVVESIQLWADEEKEKFKPQYIRARMLMDQIGEALGLN